LWLSETEGTNLQHYSSRAI